MKIVLYGLLNGLTSIILFEVINSLEYLNNYLEFILYTIIACTTIALTPINYKLTKEMTFTKSFSLFGCSILTFLLSIYPSIFIVVLIFNPIISLMFPVKLQEDDMGAGILLLAIVISYSVGIILSHFLSLGIKKYNTYLIKNISNSRNN
ncbi:hypothetical protein SOV_50520 [Sporomusa ovata DSM 2662]|nr:hypothetical protein SOV_2c03210 [Sporomusa ovata DSM 2662]